jgi:ubiquinone/menaquinone biosynthesis C-methylase UbiE
VTDPGDRRDAVRRAYEDEAVARSYEAERSKNVGQRARAALERALLGRALAGAPRGRLLDVACGTGRLSELLAGSARSYTGLDASHAMLAEARRAHANVGAWARGDALRLPFAARSFDVVVSTRFVRHLDSRARVTVFRELARVSRRLVVVDLLLSEGLVWGWKRLTHSRAWREALAARRPTHADALRELGEAGLSVVRRHALLARISQPHLYVCEVRDP